MKPRGNLLGILAALYTQSRVFAPSTVPNEGRMRADTVPGDLRHSLQASLQPEYI
jgi:hypothetical protein